MIGLVITRYMIHVINELDETFQKIGPIQNYVKKTDTNKIFNSNHRLFTVKFCKITALGEDLKMNDQLYTVKICKISARTKFWKWMTRRRFLGALLNPSLCRWSGARDGRKSFPAAGEDRYSFSSIFSFTSILLNNSQSFTILIKLP